VLLPHGSRSAGDDLTAKSRTVGSRDEQRREFDQCRTDEEAEPPKWMGRLQTASPRFSFRLGFLLLGVFPTDILTSWAVGTYLSTHDDPWWQLLPFLLLTLLLLALPALLLLLFGQRAQAFLPKAATG
jgi:hypothetical protein